MKSMKKILSLVLVLVLALGCMSINAMATDTTTIYPAVTSVQVTYNGHTYDAVFNDNGSTKTYNVRVPGANLNTGSFTVVLTSSGSGRYVSSQLDSNSGSVVYNSVTHVTTVTWSSVSLTSNSHFSIAWKDRNGVNRSGNFPLVINSGSGDPALSTLKIGGVTATVSTVYAGGVPRYSASLVYAYGTSLSNLTFEASNTANTATFELDGDPVISDDPTVTPTVTLTGTEQTLTVIDGNDSRDYRLVACVTDQDGYITVNLGVRTWAADEFNSGVTTHYDYLSLGGGSNNSGIAALALTIDSVGHATGTIAQPTWTYTEDLSVQRPVFSAYVAVKVLPGSSAMDVLYTYLSLPGIGLYPQGYDTYLSGISTDQDGDNCLSEMSCGYMSGWMYLTRYDISDVEMDMPNMSAAAYTVTSGEYVDWIYTCAMGGDFGYGSWW